MKLTPELIKQTISTIAGEDVLPLVEELKKKDNTSEFILAENIDYEINRVRNMLYRLYHANLVSFTRKKDKQKGWYIYYWTFRPNMIKDCLDKIDKQRLDGLRNRLKREVGKEFYRCPTKCMRMEFMQAMEYDFKCPECGTIMNHEDNATNLANIRENIAKLEQQIELKRQLRLKLQAKEVAESRANDERMMREAERIRLEEKRALEQEKKEKLAILKAKEAEKKRKELEKKRAAEQRRKEVEKRRKEAAKAKALAKKEAEKRKKEAAKAKAKAKKEAEKKKKEAAKAKAKAKKEAERAKAEKKKAAEKKKKEAAKKALAKKKAAEKKKKEAAKKTAKRKR